MHSCPIPSFITQYSLPATSSHKSSIPYCNIFSLGLHCHTYQGLLQIHFVCLNFSLLALFPPLSPRLSAQILCHLNLSVHIYSIIFSPKCTLRPATYHTPHVPTLNTQGKSYHLLNKRGCDICLFESGWPHPLYLFSSFIHSPET